MYGFFKLISIRRHPFSQFEECVGVTIDYIPRGGFIFIRVLTFLLWRTPGKLNFL